MTVYNTNLELTFKSESNIINIVFDNDVNEINAFMLSNLNVYINEAIFI